MSLMPPEDRKTSSDHDRSPKFWTVMMEEEERQKKAVLSATRAQRSSGGEFAEGADEERGVVGV
ncbi:hypothetical protein E4U56_001358 [Claviceps arundinis]|uniref:Uncharacterized protein n=1 Tax=Claviceps arundinis TaxID=1623583 RepID=A0A9P7MRK3_9HYPO|nr:hypothetical protein E4U56_001358 [Claviceps arundinis]